VYTDVARAASRWRGYAIREYRGRKDEPKGFGWKDHAWMLPLSGGDALDWWSRARFCSTA